MDQEKYQLVIPDTNYYRDMVSCRAACPVNTDAGAYVTAIGSGNYEQAYKIARAPNPFASICGRVCAHPCETKCRKGAVDDAIAIRALKRFVTEQYGVESDNYDKVMPKKYVHPSGKRVAIIGAGPAGMAAAHELALMGVKCTVFEAEAVPGGMMYYGIPEYRLSRKVLGAEIKAIETLGVDIVYNTVVGKDVSLAQLKKDFDAILISIGCKKSRGLKIDGWDLDGVYQGVDFLHDLNIGQYMQHKIGRRVVVIGGGNVAFDVARSVARMGNREVNLFCLEKRHEMPADLIEVEEGIEEGIKVNNAWGPVQVIGDEDRQVSGIEFKKCLSVFDENKRFSPAFDENQKVKLDCDTVIMTVGQTADLSLVPPEMQIKISKFNTLEVDPRTLMTDEPGIFAAGDVETGPKIIITSVARGKKAAQGIAEYLGLEKQKMTKVTVTNMKGYLREQTYKLHDDYDALDRINPSSIPPEDRVPGLALVEINYDVKAAEDQAKRCLRCHVIPVFNGDKCILCGGCVDVCPEYVLKMVGLDEVVGDEKMEKLVEQYYGGRFSFKDEPGKLKLGGTVMIKDEERCIRCGLCALRCPTETITMEHFKFEEVLA